MYTIMCIYIYTYISPLYFHYTPVIPAFFLLKLSQILPRNFEKNTLAPALSEGRAGRNELDEFHGVHVLGPKIGMSRKNGGLLWTTTFPDTKTNIWLYNWHYIYRYPILLSYIYSIDIPYYYHCLSHISWYTLLFTGLQMDSWKPMCRSLSERETSRVFYIVL